VVMVIGDIVCVVVLDLSGRVGVCILNRFAFSVFVPCTFDLIRRSGDAPEERLGELARW